MLTKCTVVLVVLCGIHYCNSASTGNGRQNVGGPTEVRKYEIKKNEFGANGRGNDDESDEDDDDDDGGREDFLENFRTAFLEFLFEKRSRKGSGKAGNRRKVQSGSSRLVAGPGPLGQTTLQRQEQTNSPERDSNSWRSSSPGRGFILRGKGTQRLTTNDVGQTRERIITSQVLHLSQTEARKGPNEPLENPAAPAAIVLAPVEDAAAAAALGKPKEFTRVQTYPATAVTVHTYNPDGSLKSSVTHFKPNFHLEKDRVDMRQAFTTDDIGVYLRNHPDVIREYLEGKSAGAEPFQSDWVTPPRRVQSFEKYTNPFDRRPLQTGGAFTDGTDPKSDVETIGKIVSETSEPHADLIILDRGTRKRNKKKVAELKSQQRQQDTLESFQDGDNLFDGVTMASDVMTRRPLISRNLRRQSLMTTKRKRDVTSVLLRTKQGDRVNITLPEPDMTNSGSSGASYDGPEARSADSLGFLDLLFPTPQEPVPAVEPRQFFGFADKKRKVKPKPNKEAETSEEKKEEHGEENNSNEMKENENENENESESVAIAPPPEGASVAEAKPVGLAIAGPGGVAASKPQGTAVAGPGGLAIARPVGTAIAGVEVEGSVPVGGQANKNKKKPKQEPEKADGELHYVGGLTGPIGNPQPNTFADTTNYRSFGNDEGTGNAVQDTLFFRGRQTSDGYQLKLGKKDGKYGFLPLNASPDGAANRLQRRMTSPTYFFAFSGNDNRGYPTQERNQPQFQYVN